MASGGKRHSTVVLAILAGVLSSPCLIAQLHSGPASVVLIARVESISVSATSAVTAVPQDGTQVDESERVGVKTSWAVPANRTTVRVVGGLSDGSQMVAAGNRALNSGSMAAAPSARGENAAQSEPGAKGSETLRPGDTGQTLMSQEAVSNRADSRTKQINL